uniref:[histone H4]-lysine(20) N-methyltransferase n=1 Tax=Sphenodon punctatus TaxID=8508 RepID=A0A8D0L913_SPHPU
GAGETRAILPPEQENVFIGQSKIYTFLSPTKTSGMRPPLQEENSVAHHEVKCPSKTLSETCKKDGKTFGVYEIYTKLEDLKERESGFVMPERCLSIYLTSLSRRVQGKTTQNRKVTDYFPVRRSSRKSKKELQIEEKKRIDELIESGKEEGMKIDFIDGKGRGVIATKRFNRGEFVVEYHGDLIEITDAKKREVTYAQDPSTGCYMYYFQYLSKMYCVDATKETSRLGRLINHSKCGNCQTKIHDIDGIPHLILVASRDVRAGEELLYDYGDRSRASLEAHPWLKH